MRRGLAAVFATREHDCSSFMADPSNPNPNLSTDCAHAGGENVPSQNNPAVQPIYQTSVYDFADLTQVDEIWEGRTPGFIYGRYGSPNHTALENVVAKLEGGESALASASGMASIALSLLSFLEAGDEVIVANDSYGGSVSLAARDLPRFGITARFVSTVKPGGIEAAFTTKTKAMLVETLSNPRWNVIDVGKISNLCHQRGAKLIVDNTVATPYLIRPLSLGADAVVHSATKFLAGHDDVVAGILVGNSDLIARARETAIRMGPSLGPFDAWLTVRGIKTFALRIERVCSNAFGVAKYLKEHAAIQNVYYPGLETHPQHEIIRKTMRGIGGGMVSFELKGGRETVETFLKNLGLIRFAPTLGGVTTTISHPATTSHRALTAAQRAEAGVSDTLLRLSIGIEDPQDLIAELQRALQII
jgi:cystathionine beta-lyase/cystathionine gamma-synthase